MSKTLIEFWSDIENVETADPGDIQRDILAYLVKIEKLEQRVADLLEAAEVGEKNLSLWLELNECDCNEYHQCGRSDRERALQRIREAIAKAKGESDEQ